MAIPIWITVITGFLGSGKTTLLNSLLMRPEFAGVMVVVNEFGEIGIDSDLMRGSTENIVQLENGCLCCSVKSDLIDTFRDLSIQRQAGIIPRFDRVVIETTGIADPGPVLQVILTNPMVRNAYALDGVVTTVDAVNGLSSLENFPECTRQIAVADRLVITKADIVSNTNRAIFDQLKAKLRVLNRSAPIISATKGDLDASQLFGMGLYNPETGRPDLVRWLDPTAYDSDNQRPEESRTMAAALDTAAIALTYARQGHQVAKVDEGLPHHNHDAAIRSFCLVRDEPMPLHTLQMFVDAIAREAGPRLLRVKGLVQTVERPETPAVIQGAQQIFHSLEWLTEWPTDDRRTRIVFITHGIERDHVEESLALIERMARRTAMASGRN